MNPTIQITCGLVLMALGALVAMCREGPSSRPLAIRLAIVDVATSSTGCWFLVSGLWCWIMG